MLVRKWQLLCNSCLVANLNIFTCADYHFICNSMFLLPMVSTFRCIKRFNFYATKPLYFDQPKLRHS